MAGIGVEFALAPVDASMRTPASSSIETFAIPQRGLIVACQYTAVPSLVVSISCSKIIGRELYLGK